VATPIHLQPTAPLAERVLLPGDPGRALLLAQTLLVAPKMFNHNRGLWGYSGNASDGRPLTIQSTGIGGPSTAIVISELYQLGARTMVRVGTCGALDSTVSLGQLVVASEAISDDGTSSALGGGGRIAADPAVVSRLVDAAPPNALVGAVVSTDLFYDDRPNREYRWQAAGAVAVEMEAATLFTFAARHGLRAGAILIVSDLLLGARRRIDVESLRAAERQLGQVAARALAG
jgi:DeoD family purine-nucleoside phosphorylase